MGLVPVGPPNKLTRDFLAHCILMADPAESRSTDESAPRAGDGLANDERAVEDGGAAGRGAADGADNRERTISLDALKGAFAEMLGGADTIDSRAVDENRSDSADRDNADDLDTASAEVHGAEDDLAEVGAEVTPREVVEAILFVGSPDNRPLPAKRMTSILRGVTTEEIEQVVRDLNAEYRRDGAPYEILCDGDGYRMALRSEFERTRQKFYGRVRQARLSQAAVEVLSVVAYYQPITRDEVSRIRGSKSGPLLNQLVRRQLLRIDRDEEKKRLVHYQTTDRFLRLFQLDNLDDLPRSEDLELDEL